MFHLFRYWFRDPLFKITHYDRAEPSNGATTTPNPYASNPFRPEAYIN